MGEKSLFFLSRYFNIICDIIFLKNVIKVKIKKSFRSNLIVLVFEK